MPAFRTFSFYGSMTPSTVLCVAVHAAKFRHDLWPYSIAEGHDARNAVPQLQIHIDRRIADQEIDRLGLDGGLDLLELQWYQIELAAGHAP